MTQKAALQMYNPLVMMVPISSNYTYICKACWLSYSWWNRSKRETYIPIPALINPPLTQELSIWSQWWFLSAPEGKYKDVLVLAPVWQLEPEGHVSRASHTSLRLQTPLCLPLSHSAGEATSRRQEVPWGDKAQSILLALSQITLLPLLKFPYPENCCPCLSAPR